MHINLKMERTFLVTLALHITIFILPIWYRVIAIEMQTRKLHEFSNIFCIKSMDDIWNQNFVSITAELAFVLKNTSLSMFQSDMAWINNLKSKRSYIHLTVNSSICLYKICGVKLISHQSSVHSLIVHYVTLYDIQGVPEKAGTNVCVNISKHILCTFM